MGYVLSIITKHSLPNVAHPAGAFDEILADLPAILLVAAAAAIFVLLVAITVRVMRWVILRRHPEIETAGAARGAPSSYEAL